METYQPIYDAVRSRLCNGDIGAAIESSVREAGISHYTSMAAEAVMQAAAEYERPCALFRPKIYIDGNQWCALYGDNIQDGVAGFGDSPANAMWDFDKKFTGKLNAKQETP